ncbi:MAG: PEP-CTERM sorting domain-containing protein [Planctomycetota bacterium]
MKRLMLGLLLLPLCGPSAAIAQSINNYFLSETFTLPDEGGFTALPDGRLLFIDGADVVAETAAGSRNFATIGSLDPSFPLADDFAPAFVAVSPDGGTLAVGNGGGPTFVDFQIGLFPVADFNLGTPTSGSQLAFNHFSATFLDNDTLVVANGNFGSPSQVFALELDGTSTLLVDGVGGASAGIAVDAGGNLFTGNGFADSDPSTLSMTGDVKGFAAADWQAALSGGAPVDFENSGELIVSALSANSLGFDSAGNLHVGGSNSFGGGDSDFFALASASAVDDALAGLGVVDRLDPLAFRALDPDPLADSGSGYRLVFNAVTSELIAASNGMGFVLAVPEPSAAILLVIAAAAILRRRK